MTELIGNSSPAQARVELKYVRNLGNYESIHVSIGIEDFVRRDEKVADAVDRIYTLVEKKLVEKMEEIERDLKK